MADVESVLAKLRPIIFGNLCLLERISVGGMAEVFRAKPFHAPNFDRLLAVKRILPNLAEDDEFIQMFHDEAKIAVQLDHPSIVEMYELGKRGNSHYLVMEYVAGHDLLDLANYYRRRRLAMPPEQAAYIIRCVAGALGHAHEQVDEDDTPLGIVHRDVSPQNVLVSYAGDVKLIDFGIAKVANRTTETQVGVLKGKFSYMSPEQVTGRPVDNRSDLFSLGTVLHELLTARRLFSAASDFQTLERVRDAKVEPPSSYSDSVPYQLDNIALKALARDPDKRYQSAAELVADLDAYLDVLDPPYTRDSLSDWMVRTFSGELARERERREVYKRFVTPEDVQAHNERIIDELRRSLGAPEVDEGEPELEEWEITQVADEDYRRLLQELEEGELEKGKQDEVLAGRKLARLLHEHSDQMLASMDLPDVQEPEEIPEALSEYHGPGTSSSFPWPLFLVLVLALVSALVWQAVRTSGPDPEAADGIIVLEVEPQDDLQIFLDGALRATRAPIALQGLRAGVHTIEIRHPDYQTFRAEVSVLSGHGLQRNIKLEPLPQGQATALLAVEPPDAEVWLDGERVTVPSDGRAELVVSGRQRHLLELRAPGYFPAERTLTLEPGGAQHLEMALTPISGTLVLRSDPPGRVLVDGVERGQTDDALVIAALDPAIPHTLRIEPAVPGFRTYEAMVVFDAAQELNLFATLRRIGDDRPIQQPAVGYLAVDTGNKWYHLLLDGRETGQTTPIPAETPFAVRAGVREVTLSRAGDTHSLRVDVPPQGLVVVQCDSREWRCSI